tara:strand:- start:2815 stop:3573 length:759 start_codon:yes stop_codon:yes gene_type:complete
MVNSDFEKYRYNIFSQNGEDGIIQELLFRLQEKISKDPWCVEFGAWDGIHMSNTFNLVKNGWNGLYIEGNSERFKELTKTCEKFSKLLSECKYVEKDYESPNSLDNILKSKKIPINFDILSIDVDSFDLEIWEQLKGFSPKIVIIEINSNYLPGILKWHTGNKPVNKFGGNSFSATLMVAKNKGYQLICHTGNMIFIKNDYLELLNISKKYIQYPDLLFDDSTYIESKRMNLSIELINFFKKIIKKSKSFFP